jgi:hypothetical protein
MSVVKRNEVEDGVVSGEACFIFSLALAQEDPRVEPPGSCCCGEPDAADKVVVGKSC